ncbi:hypothetical protein B5X24_HaOG215176 [Helicoverpa armigera]|nr:hypothetical protein B5X24_HaOG215176 [Helicoverpa armigera]
MYLCKTEKRIHVHKYNFNCPTHNIIGGLSIINHTLQYIDCRQFRGGIPVLILSFALFVYTTNNGLSMKYARLLGSSIVINFTGGMIDRPSSRVISDL